MSANNGGPAFPVTNYVNVDGETHESKPQGMTLRDYFAANALSGISSHLAGPEVRNDETIVQAHARWSYSVADAMLKARES